MKCRICGNEVHQEKTGGRIKEYCSKECRELFKFKNAFSNAFSKIKFADKKHLQAVRSDIWSMANLRNSDMKTLK